MKYTRHATRTSLITAFAITAVLLTGGIMIAKMSLHASAATLQATPSNLSTVFGSAQSGDTIELASGSYSFNGGTKSGNVTLKPANGASVTMSATFSSSSFITLDGMTISSLGIDGRTHDIKILNNTFTGQANLNMTGNSNANILVDGNSFDGITVCADCAEGRLEIGQYPAGTAPVGVVISHNHFGGGGQSDGIQTGAYGVDIEYNTFDGIIQASNYTRHIDNIQGYGQSHTTVNGNYFKNFDNGTVIMMPDGGNSEVFTNNVIAGGKSSTPFQLGHIQGATIKNNVMQGFELTAFVSGNDSSPNKNITIQNNIMLNADFNTSGCVNCNVSYNLFNSSAYDSGSPAYIGTPTFVGGSSPTTYAGYAQAANSIGHVGSTWGNPSTVNTVPQTAAESDGTQKDFGPDFSGTGTSTGGGGGGTGATYHTAQLSALLAHYGATSGMTATDGDLDGNGAVNIYDLGILLSSYSP